MGILGVVRFPKGKTMNPKYPHNNSMSIVMLTGLSIVTMLGIFIILNLPAAHYPAHAQPATIPPAQGEDEFYPTDEYYDVQQEHYADIGIPTMWAAGITGMDPARPIIIAVIDTGVYTAHPDLQGNWIQGKSFIDEQEYTDESFNSHGTKVAGVIAARINNGGTGVAGIAGGDAASETMGLQIVPLRIGLDAFVQEEDTDADYCLRSANAIRYAVEQGVHIINMSYTSGGCEEEWQAVRDAYNAGVTLVAAAGNNDNDEPVYPAAYCRSRSYNVPCAQDENDDLVIAVAGVYPSGAKGDQSSFGTWVDVSAPYRALSLRRPPEGKECVPGDISPICYEWDAGTSFAAPYVSGLLGLLMSNFGWSRNDAVDAILSTADASIYEVKTNRSFRDQQLLGTGRIDAGKAIDFKPLRRIYLPILLRNNGAN